MQVERMAAIVTGGASGLGRATVETLLAAGARVAVFDLVETGRPLDGDVAFFRVDVTDEASVANGVAAAAQAFGPARILVNCAGVAAAIRTLDKDGTPHPLDVFRRTIAVNLVGTFTVSAHFAAALAGAEAIAGERGVVVNTASVAAFDGQIGQAAYAASKGGIAAMTLPLARDLASHAIRVMTIAPGVFLTPMVEALPPPVRDALGAQVPHPARLGRPEEFAQLVEAIVRNPMLNGEVIRLDGAIRMAPR